MNLLCCVEDYKRTLYTESERLIMTYMWNQFFQFPLYHFLSGSSKDIIVSLLTKKSMLDNFSSYLNNQGENFPSIFKELSQKLFRKI